MTTITGHEARDRLDELIDSAAQSHQPVTIIGKRHDAILISAEDWVSLQAALHPLPPAADPASPDDAQGAGNYADAGPGSRDSEAMQADTQAKPAE